LHGCANEVDRQTVERRARCRIDRREPRVAAFVRDRAREKPGRMTRADFDDPRRAERTNGRVGDGRVEAGEPVLLEARRRRLPVAECKQTIEMALCLRKPGVELRFGAREIRLQRRVRSGRRNRVGVAVRDDETARAPRRRRQRNPDRPQQRVRAPAQGELR
jgi:hypothetical protein